MLPNPDKPHMGAGGGAAGHFFYFMGGGDYSGIYPSTFTNVHF